MCRSRSYPQTLQKCRKILLYRFSRICAGMRDRTKPRFIGKNTTGHAFFHTHEKLPTAPPVTDAGRNAPAKIAPKTCGTFFIFSKTTPSASTMYITAINGTSFFRDLPDPFDAAKQDQRDRSKSTIPMIRFNIGAASSEMIL